MRGARGPRLATPCSCALALALALLPGAANAQVADLDEGVIEVVAGRLAPVTLVVLVAADGSMLLPVGALAAYVGYETAGDGALTVPLAAGARNALDAAAGVLVIGADTMPLGAAAAVRDGVLHLRADLFAALLAARHTLAVATLTLVLQRTPPFPAEQRIIDGQRRALLLARQRYAATGPAADSVAYPAVTGAGVVDWEIATTGTDLPDRTSLRAQAGAALLGGDLSTSILLQSGSASGGDASFRYHRVFPHSPLLRQVRAGDIITAGLFARFVTGIELTNRTFTYDNELGSITLAPELPAGWEYEVVQGAQLLGYSEPGARDGVTVPLRAGTNPVQIRMIGPAGEEVVTTMLYQMPVSMLRAGAVEYTLGGGRCEARSCTTIAHADVRYGASPHLTLGGGLEHSTDAARMHWRPYIVGSFTTGVRWTGEVQVMPGAVHRGSTALFVRDRSVARLRGSIAREAYAPVGLHAPAPSRWEAQATWDERLDVGAGERRLLRHARLDVAAGGAAELERWRVATSASFAAGHAELRYESDVRSMQRRLLAGRMSVLAPVRHGGRSYRPMLSGGLGGNRSGLALAELAISVQPTGSSALLASAQWLRGAPQPALSIGWTARVGGLQAAVRSASGGHGRASSAAVLSGSTAITHQGVLSSRPVARTGYAGLHGVVFIDNDGDGVFSQGDEPLAGAVVMAGGVPVTADAKGRYQVWGLRPYIVTDVVLDSTRMTDPNLAPAHGTQLVRPAPNTARRLDLPLVRTRELLGSVEALRGVATAAGVTIEIVNLDSGVVLRATTYADGQFYVSRLRPGRYAATVAASALAVLRARAGDALSFVVPAAGDDILIELPPILLEPAH